MLKITTTAQIFYRILGEAYTEAMSIFVKATLPPLPKTDRVKQIAILYAVVIVIMAVAQLYTFDTFIELIQRFNLPLPESLSYAVAPLLIVCEVFALPFLLRMTISPAFRALSMVCGWLVALKWFFISLWVVATVQPVETIGFLGTVGEVAPGWWAVLMSAALGVLAAWVAWGMWPFPLKKK